MEYHIHSPKRIMKNHGKGPINKESTLKSGKEIEMAGPLIQQTFGCSSKTGIGLESAA